MLNCLLAASAMAFTLMNTFQDQISATGTEPPNVA